MLRENGQELRGVPLLEPASLRATTDHPRRFVVAQLTIAAGRSKNVTDKPGYRRFEERSPGGLSEFAKGD